MQYNFCLSSRNMIDKTMCEVSWRNISDFYVNLRVEVAAVSRNRYGVEKVNNMKYWHPHLPLGQYNSVSTLVLYRKYILRYTIIIYYTSLSTSIHIKKTFSEIFYVLVNCVMNYSPVISHDKIVRQKRSRTTSLHSFITTVWWYNILYQTS